MASVVLSIKTAQDLRDPPSLANGEIAYSYASDKFFIGQTDTANSAPTVEYIGGKLLVDKVANLENQVFGGIDRIQGNLATFGNMQVGELFFSDQSVRFKGESVMISGPDIASNRAIHFTTGTSGQILQIAANGTPSFANVSASSIAGGSLDGGLLTGDINVNNVSGTLDGGNF